MKAPDNAFFEEYKRLDKVCAEMFIANRGVSDYIETMDRHFQEGKDLVKNWVMDYKALKHARWVRNQIAHEAGSQRISQPSDTDFVKDFRRRILLGHDPLTELTKAMDKGRGRVKKSSSSGKKRARRSKHKLLLAVTVIMILLVIAAYFYYMVY